MKKKKINWLKRINDKFSSVKWIAVLIVIVSSVGGILIYLDKTKGAFDNLTKGLKEKEGFHEIVNTSHKKSLVTSMNDYFHRPHEFVYIPSKAAYKHQIKDVVVGSDGKINVTLTVESLGCLDFNYILINEALDDGTIVHRILPTKNTSDSILKHSLFESMPKYYPDKDDDSPGVNNSCFLGAGEFSSKVKFSTPLITCKISNNEDDVMSMDDIIIRVHKSRPDSFPNLTFNEGVIFDLPLFNTGWGRAQNMHLYFNIIPGDSAFVYGPPYKNSMYIPMIRPRNGGVYTADIASTERFFRQEGLNTSYIANHADDLGLVYSQNAAGDSDIYSLPISKEEFAKIYGRYSYGRARMVGMIKYDGQTPGGNWKTDSFNFNYIQTLNFGAIGGDEFDEFENVYQIPLEANGDDYEAPYYAARKTILRKSVGNFKLSLSSKMSAYHLFDIIIHYNGYKEIIIPNIFLQEYVPNSSYYSIRHQQTNGRQKKRS
jgi:hypothetical protein